MKHVSTETTYLEMRAPNMPPRPTPSAATRLEQVSEPEIDFYRFLYDSVGNNYHWVDRRLLSDEQLGAILNDDRVDLWVLYVEDQPAGFGELDRRVGNEIEVAYFGLFPAFIGRGLGKYLLISVLEQAWKFQPSRVWLHTCDLDHPAALNNYLTAGFSVYDRQVIQQVVFD